MVGASNARVLAADDGVRRGPANRPLLLREDSDEADMRFPSLVKASRAAAKAPSVAAKTQPGLRRALLAAADASSKPV